jgi:hypothetical protein
MKLNRPFAAAGIAAGSVGLNHDCAHMGTDCGG